MDTKYQNTYSETLSRSPDRHTFSKKQYSITLTTDSSEKEKEAASTMLTLLNSELEQEKDPTWAVNNLEYDLRSNNWILEKVRTDKTYAQNLYAALCNNDFQRLDVMSILTDQLWSCSWRYAGGIIANMRQEGDYIDWYCSGIRDLGDDGESIDSLYDKRRYVHESFVTDEIKQDLLKLGWRVVDDQSN